jgi:hypothetical protein
MFLPWSIGPLPAGAAGHGPVEIAAAYAVLALLFAGWHMWFRGRARPGDDAATEEMPS